MSEESRRIAEALGPDRDRRTRKARERAERRERIATAALSGLTANLRSWDPRGLAVMAADAADALMAELDRRRDAELEEARDA